MSKVLIGAIIVVVIALGAIGLVLSRTTNQPGNTDSVALERAMEQETSLRELMNLANNQQCSFSNQEAKTEGTIFVGGGKMRGDFSTNQEGKAVSSHMISDGSDVYIWSDDMPTGVKMSLGKIDSMTETAGQTEAVDLDQKGSYACSAWQVDNSKFVAPDIEFSDLSSLFDIEESLDTSDSGESQTPETCAVCDSVPAESQAQCKAALGC